MAGARLTFPRKNPVPLLHHTVGDRQDISRQGGSQPGRRTNRERAPGSPQCRCKELKERERQHEDGGLDSSLLQPGGEHEGAAAINGLPPNFCAVSVLFPPRSTAPW